MSYSRTLSSSSTTTRTDARRVASRVAADLRRLQLYYGRPSDSEIEQYVDELIEYLASGFLSWVEYGFKSTDDRRLICLRYEATPGRGLSSESPGGVPAREAVDGAVWYSYLTDSWRLGSAGSEEQESFYRSLPFQRTGAPEPTDGNGRWIQDRTYASNETGARRKTFQSW